MGFTERFFDAVRCAVHPVRTLEGELYERKMSKRGTQRLKIDGLVENNNRLTQEMIEAGRRKQEDLERAAINSITHKTI